MCVCVCVEGHTEEVSVTASIHSYQNSNIKMAAAKPTAKIIYIEYAVLYKLHTSEE